MHVRVGRFASSPRTCSSARTCGRSPSSTRRSRAPTFLFIAIPGHVDLDHVVNRMLIAAAKTLGADKVVDIKVDITPDGASGRCARSLAGAPPRRAAVRGGGRGRSSRGHRVAPTGQVK